MPVQLIVSVGMAVFLLLAIAASLIAFIFYKRWKDIKATMVDQEEDTKRRIYELAILNELGDRIGYSLNVEKIVDVITGSLHQFIEYSSVSYMLLEPEKVIFKVHLEESVTRNFIDDIQTRMLQSLSALTDKTFEESSVEETLSGAILVDEIEAPVKSLFNIPLAIGDKVVGILTVAHTKPGLYEEEEMTILYKITNQASQAVTRLQEVVHTEQRKLNAMVTSMSEGVVMTDIDYRIVVVNPAAKEAIGLQNKKEELTIFDFIDNLESKFDIRGKLEESVKLDRVLTSDDIILNGRFYKIIVSPVKSRVGVTKGKVLGGVVIFRDITREKQVEQLREDFTSMMAHELRSPLVGIQKISQLFSGDKADNVPEEQRDYFAMIDRSANDMLMLVNDMLDAAKIEAGKFQLNKEETDFRDLVSDRLDFYAAQAKERKITLQSTIAESVPPTVTVDPARLQQVVNNLVSNALKFTEPGGTITLQAFQHDPSGDLSDEAKRATVSWFVPAGTQLEIKAGPVVVFAVTDTGSGIPEGELKHLFSKFRQLTQEKPKLGSGGTGLGLVVAKGITEAHGGEISVASRDGEGSTFFFTIPLANKTILKPPNEAKEDQAQASDETPPKSATSPKTDVADESKDTSE